MIPNCPKCGVSARYRVTLRWVKTEIASDGTDGKARHYGKTVPAPVTWECGGGHRWTTSNPEIPLTQIKEERRFDPIEHALDLTRAQIQAAEEERLLASIEAPGSKTTPVT